MRELVWLNQFCFYEARAVAITSRLDLILDGLMRLIKESVEEKQNGGSVRAGLNPGSREGVAVEVKYRCTS